MNYDISIYIMKYINIILCKRMSGHNGTLGARHFLPTWTRVS